MKKILAVFMLFALCSGCANLHKQIFTNIHEGDSREHVLRQLGAPDEYRPLSGDIDAWIYSKYADTCVVAIKNGVVWATACKENPNYIDPASAALIGLSNGLKENRSITCTSYDYGSMNETTCR